MPRKPRKSDPPAKQATPDGPPAAPSRFRTALPLILLCLLCCVAYLNADHEEFLFDSRMANIENPRTTDLGETVKWFLRAPLKPTSKLTWVTFSANHALNKAIGFDGFDITTFLMVNVIIHAANACLLYLLIRALLRQLEPDRPPATWIPLVPAMLFAVHPIHASSVAYILQRRGALATTFYLITVLIYLRVRKPDTPPQKRTPRHQAGKPAPAWPRRRIVLACLLPVFYWLSFKSKAFALPLPFAVLAIEFCLRAIDPRSLRRYLLVLIPGLMLSAIAPFVYLWSRDLFDAHTFRILPWGPEHMWGPWLHFLTESRAFIHYWKLLLLPLPQWSCIDHHFAVSNTLWEHYALVAVAAHAILLTLAVVGAFKRYTLAAIGVFWFYIALIPYILLPQQELLVEYKSYLPSIGLGLILAEGLRRIRSVAPLKAQVVVVAGVAALLLVTTIRRNVIYQSSINLWTDAVEKSPNYPRPHMGLGGALAERGDFDQAIVHYRKAVELNPRYVEAIYNLGDALYEIDDIPGAIEQFTRSVELKADFVLGHNSLANALLDSGDAEGAKHHYAEAIKHEPDCADAHFNLANVLVEEGDREKAASHYEQAIKSDPEHASAHCALGSILWLEGDHAAAISQYEKALEINPDHPFSHRNLAELLEQRGQFEDAIGHYRESLRLEPEWWNVVSDRAWDYATHPDPSRRDPSRAIQLAELACRATNRKEPAALGALAAAYAGSGRLDLARPIAREAVQLARASGQEQLAAALRNRLQQCLAPGSSHPSPNPDNR